MNQASAVLTCCSAGAQSATMARIATRDAFMARSSTHRAVTAKPVPALEAMMVAHHMNGKRARQPAEISTAGAIPRVTNLDSLSANKPPVKISSRQFGVDASIHHERGDEMGDAKIPCGATSGHDSIQL